jgi:4'-phosphopantetheinyl transferase
MAQVQLWWLDLDAQTGALEEFEQSLSPQERQRAVAFYFSKDRRRYSVCRCLLRKLLGAQLGIPPVAVPLRQGPYGKPYLIGEELQFNVSHTSGVALIALAWGRALGVDVELIRPLPDALEIARSFFSPTELSVLTALPMEQQLKGFFALWCRKEAYIKARGLGLYIPLNSFSVRLDVDMQHLTIGIDHWILTTVQLGHGYTAALCVEGADCNLVPRLDLSTFALR